jgi:hypothetical protein
MELGFLITSFYKRNIKNIIIENRLSLYSDYIIKFVTSIVDYDLSLEVGKRTRKTNIGIHVIYDDDIKAKQRNQRTASYLRTKNTIKTSFRSRNRL